MFSKVHPMNCAVTDQDGVVPFWPATTLYNHTTHEPTSNRKVHLSVVDGPIDIYHGEDTRLKQRTCRSVRLDSFVQDHKINDLHAIKIDVEGAEESVIRGALHTLRVQSPLILIELHAAADFLAIVNLFKSVGYKPLACEWEELQKDASDNYLIGKQL